MLPELPTDFLIEGQKIHIHSMPFVQSPEENRVALPAERLNLSGGEGRSQAEMPGRTGQRHLVPGAST